MAPRKNSQEVNQMQKRFLDLFVGMLVVLLPSAVVGGDVTVELDAGAGFSVKNNGARGVRRPPFIGVQPFGRQYAVRASACARSPA